MRRKAVHAGAHEEDASGVGLLRSRRVGRCSCDEELVERSASERGLRDARDRHIHDPHERSIR
jgi:hypothetical protein